MGGVWRCLMGLVTLLSGGCSGLDLVDSLTPHTGYRPVETKAYGPHPRQKLDIYRPETGGPYPVAVFFYGGSWQTGERAAYRFVGQSLASAGILTVIADYRLWPEVVFPTFVEDGAAAVVWALAHSAEYGGDPRRVTVVGHSAGAMIAALLILDPQYLMAAGSDRSAMAQGILLASPVRFDPEPALRPILYPPGETLSPMPLDHVEGGRNPPIILLNGARDSVVPPVAGETLAQAVRQEGGRAELRIYPGIGHATLVGGLARPLRFLGSMREDVIALIRGAEPAVISPRQTSQIRH